MESENLGDVVLPIAGSEHARVCLMVALHCRHHIHIAHLHRCNSRMAGFPCIGLFSYRDVSTSTPQDQLCRSIESLPLKKQGSSIGPGATKVGNYLLQNKQALAVRGCLSLRFLGGLVGKTSCSVGAFALDRSIVRETKKFRETTGEGRQ